MAGCLACKSCAGQCPVKVNVPEFRSRFLERYHQRYLRPLRDYLIGSLEFSLPLFARMPRLYNGVMGSPLVTRLLAERIGMVDSPLLSDFDFKALAARHRLTVATPAELGRLSAAQRGKSLILVQDAFTRYFETPVFAAFIELASRMGYRVWLAPFMANGKPLHVQGFLPAFERTARRTAKGLQALAGFDIPLVGLDPAMTLVYRQEYRKIAGLECPDVLLPQEWLLKALDGQPKLPAKNVAFRLLGHCTEKTNAAPSAAMWLKVFEQAGLQVAAEATGCCGMSGTYGHEARNLETSRTIFAQSWEPALDSGAAAEPLATGYSCRSQVARIKNATLRHPIQALLEHLQ
jgi:Fe-S oxidoreductase